MKFKLGATGDARAGSGGDDCVGDRGDAVSKKPTVLMLKNGSSVTFVPLSDNDTPFKSAGGLAATDCRCGGVSYQQGIGSTVWACDECGETIDMETEP